MNKRSQIGIFVIISIIIIILFILLTFNNDSAQKEILSQEKLNYYHDPTYIVKNYIEQCLEFESQRGLNYALRNNGDYIKGAYSTPLTYPTFFHVNFLFENIAITPTNFNKNTIINSIELFLNDTIPLCLNLSNNIGSNKTLINHINLSVQEKMKFDFLLKNISNNTPNLKSHDLEIKLNFPLKVQIDDKVFFIENFKSQINGIPRFENITKDVDEFLIALKEQTEYTIAYKKYLIELDNYNNALNDYNAWLAIPTPTPPATKGPAPYVPPLPIEPINPNSLSTYITNIDTRPEINLTQDIISPHDNINIMLTYNRPYYRETKVVFKITTTS